VAKATENRGGVGWMDKLKGIGWAIYTAGFAVWLFGYLSTGHARVFDWDVFTPWWISSFVPDREAELGFALMFASMIPINWRAGRKRNLPVGFSVAAQAPSAGAARRPPKWWRA
jgi:hypothetical protein